ncbi:hypothetical protein BGX21_007011, partial [Mortierella sp. AD011]
MGDKFREYGNFKRAAKCYNLANPYSPLEVQERLNSLPQGSLSSESILSFGKGQHRAILKEKFSNVFKSSPRKPTLTGPYFPKGVHPSLPPSVLQDTVASQGTVNTFNEVKDINSFVVSYIAADLETRKDLRNRIGNIINESDKSFVSLEMVQELVVIAKIPDRIVFLHVLTQMLKVLKEKPLVASIVVQGMAVAINSCPKEIYMDDMQGTYLEILKPLKENLINARKEKNEYQLNPLLTALTALLNAMVCKKVSGLDRENIFNPLAKLFDSLMSHDDTTVAFSALVAGQALAHIRNDESLAMSIFRRARLAVAMAGDISSVISSADISGLISAYDKFNEMCDFSVKHEWYLGLAYVDGILERQGWSSFEAFVLHSKFNSNECFLQGICLRLEQIAATQQTDISNDAIKFLQDLATSPAKTVQKSAQAALKRLGIVDKAGPHPKDGTSDHLIPQCRRDDLPPVWDPIWLKTESKLLKAVQQRDQRNVIVDNIPTQNRVITQAIEQLIA